MELNNIIIYFFETGIDHTEFIDAVEPFNPIIIGATTQSVSQNIIRPRRHDVNLRDLEVKVSGGDGLYNKASGGIICSAGFWLQHQHLQNHVYIITAGYCIGNEAHDVFYYYCQFTCNTYWKSRI
ncbi:hypothetical protein F8M41_006568 [Gigaspora margarita]|uniref:Uncharacterized protein n=1 Tax=Gigaspora margarita TaxID=4874 RepID=A0A8H4A563_GIGMA|nr:hypothetical protein F8M41_006568 [Gigaspora margarita]